MKLDNALKRLAYRVSVLIKHSHLARKLKACHFSHAASSAPQCEFSAEYESLQKSETHTKSLYESISSGIILHDSMGQILYANKAACDLLGLTLAELRGKSPLPPSWSAFYNDGTPFDLHTLPLQAPANSGREISITYPGNGRHWLLCHTDFIADSQHPEFGEVVTTLVDITERKCAEMHEAVLKEINQMVLLEQPIGNILTFITNQLGIIFGAYPWAWIGMKEHDGTVSFHSIVGVGANLNDLLKVRWDDTSEGQNPVGLAIRTGKTQVHDLLQNSAFKPWWPIINQLELKSVASFPLKSGGEVLGALTLYSTQSNFFEPRLISRLEDFSIQIALSLSTKTTRQQLIRSNLLSERTHDIFLLLDHSGCILEANLAAVRAYDYTKNELLSLNVRDLWVQSSAESQSEQVFELNILYETTHRRKDGSTFPVEITSQKTMLGDTPVNFYIIRDISERREAQAALSASEERHQSMLEYMSNAVAVYEVLGDGEDFIIKEVNAAVERMSSLPRSKMLGQSITKYFPDQEQLNLLVGAFRRVWSTGQSEQIPLKFYQNGQLTAWRENYIYKLPSGELVTVFEDTTAQKLAEEAKQNLIEQLSHQAHHDTLSGLPNRLLFNERLFEAIAHASPNQKIAVLFLDIDRFKLINDTMGHSSGDLLLQNAANRLKTCLSAEDTIARQGGDEFLIVLPRLAEAEDAASTALKLLAAFAKPFNLDNHEMFITASIGIAIYPTDGDNIETLVKHADSAMYYAKDLGRNNYQFFNSTLNASANDRLSMENSLRKALERQEFQVYYQPQVDIETQMIIGAEALIRWHSPEKGLISPAQFIPIAEETGLIVPIGEWVLRTTCKQIRTWQKQGLAPEHVAVNLSPRQFRQRNLVSLVAQILHETGLDPTYLELEITEGIAMENVEFTIAMLNDLKEMGIRISIDDFGTGFSSLNYLRRLPLDTLKIDQSFVQDIGSNDAVVSAIISLAQNLGLRVIAEGVETTEQLEFLRARKCQEMQGYLFSEPVPALVFAKILLNNQSLPYEKSI